MAHWGWGGAPPPQPPIPYPAPLPATPMSHESSSIKHQVSILIIDQLTSPNTLRSVVAKPPAVCFRQKDVFRFDFFYNKTKTVKTDFFSDFSYP